jgi:hypothetical protein
MTCRAVFTGRRRCHDTPRTERVVISCYAVEREKIAKSACGKRRDIESTDGLREMTKCVAAAVAVHIGVRRFARANSIENNDRGSTHQAWM